MDTGEQHVIRTLNPEEHWIKINVCLPASWRGHNARLVAINGTTTDSNWLGVSPPRGTNWFSFLGSQTRSLAIIPIYAVHFLLFLIPGLYIALLIARYRYINRCFMLMLAITLTSLIGYGIFWIYFSNHHIGRLSSIATILVSAYVISRYGRKQFFITALSSIDVMVPMVLMFLVGLFYTSLLYAVDLALPPLSHAQMRFTWRLPPDNAIPFEVANRMYRGMDPRDLGGGWHSSDRPPLQTGLVLIQRPLKGLTGLPAAFHYQVLALIIQCAWVPAIWALCRMAHLGGRPIGIVMLFSILSGFFLVNTVYVWPKMLAAALTAFAFAVLLQRPASAQAPSMTEVLIAALAAALGVLAHGGVVFTLASFAIVLVLPRFFIGIRQGFLACTVFALLVAPWFAYQGFYDPPGNRLVKWHIAGVIDIDKRSSWQAISDAYRALSGKQVVANKLENIKALVRNPLFQKSDFSYAMFENWRAAEFFYVFKALGVLNLGWLLLGLSFIRSRGPDKILTSVRIMLAVSLISLLIWCLLIFNPGTTSIHSGSYATMFLLFTGLAIMMATLPQWLCYTLLCWHGISFAATWLFTVPANTADNINIPMVILAGLTFINIANLLYCSRRMPEREERILQPVALPHQK